MQSAIAIADGVRKGERSAVDAAEASLAAIDAKKDLNAFLTVASREDVLAQARAVDAKRPAERGLLAGVTVALKDALATRGMRTTCASKMLASWIPPYDATVVARLRAADALVVGKTN